VLGPVDLVGDGRRDVAPIIGAHLTLAAARRLTAALRHKVATGQDPGAAHQAERRSIALSAADTFPAAASDFILQYAKRKTRRWIAQARLLGLRETDKGLEPIDGGLAMRWRNKPLSEIDADTLFRLLEEVRHKGIPGLERRSAEPSEPRSRAMYAVLSRLFGWLTEKRRISISPMMTLKRPSPSRARDRALNNQEIVAFWQATDKITPPFGAVFKLLLLTGCRLNEVAHMEIGELTDDASVWTIPGNRTKNHRIHVVPLPPLAQRILKGVTRSPDCHFIFSTNAKSAVSGFSKMKKRLDAMMKGVPPWRLHDLRRSAATGMAEIGIAPHVIELVLNHVSGARAGVAGIYNRATQMPERQAALEKWAEHVAGLIGRAKP
jgi:integrase